MLSYRPIKRSLYTVDQRSVIISSLWGPLDAINSPVIPLPGAH